MSLFYSGKADLSCPAAFPIGPDRNAEHMSLQAELCEFLIGSSGVVRSAAVLKTLLHVHSEDAHTAGSVGNVIR